ncbi:hypothetical protein, partial [Streptomyces boluensis]|uniref:hypothetical protein n=1 Tax=Streptomyces boluensis TaxID=1775135 RepID=UPI001CB707BD
PEHQHADAHRKVLLRRQVHAMRAEFDTADLRAAPFGALATVTTPTEQRRPALVRSSGELSGGSVAPGLQRHHIEAVSKGSGPWNRGASPAVHPNTSPAQSET